jgi:hypothetical protein
VGSRGGGGRGGDIVSESQRFTVLQILVYRGGGGGGAFHNIVTAQQEVKSIMAIRGGKMEEEGKERILNTIAIADEGVGGGGIYSQHIELEI